MGRPAYMHKLGYYLATFVLLASGTLSAQAPLAQAQPPAPDVPSFEVAAIKPNNTGSGNSSSNTNDGLFTAENVTLKGIMQYEAYDIPQSRMIGGPKWLDVTRFDIRAKVDEATAANLNKLDSKDKRLQSMAMFQQLLADRFRLKVHWETRQLPIYALVPAKNGAKLKPADPKEGMGTSSHGNGSSVKLEATGQTLAEFAQSLTADAQQDLGRTVVDQSGIQGKYDYALNWTHDSARTSGSSDGSQPETGPSLFTAIQEQLGLKLESTKGPVEVLVIDQAELPTEN
jgi:uncharacterized protein (TIGR03435 family)